MNYEEIVENYNNMTLREFGTYCKEHFNNEENILGSVTSVIPALIGASLFSMVKNYNAMHLNFRHTNFMMRLYIEAVNKGVVPTWHDDDYKEHLSNYVIDCNSLENGLKILIEKYHAQYEKDRFFHMVDNSKYDLNQLKKAHNSFANYGSDEKPLFYRHESLFGFTKGFVGTDKRLYFSNKDKFSVKYENIVDFYFEYKEIDTGLTINLFRYDDIMNVVNQIPRCFNADNIYLFLKIMYYDENTGKLCDCRFCDRCRWDNFNNVTFAWLFTQLLKDVIIVKNYDRYNEARRKIEK